MRLAPILTRDAVHFLLRLGGPSHFLTKQTRGIPPRSQRRWIACERRSGPRQAAEA